MLLGLSNNVMLVQQEAMPSMEQLQQNAAKYEMLKDRVTQLKTQRAQRFMIEYSSGGVLIFNAFEPGLVETFPGPIMQLIESSKAEGDNSCSLGTNQDGTRRKGIYCYWVLVTLKYT